MNNSNNQLSADIHAAKEGVKDFARSFWGERKEFDKLAYFRNPASMISTQESLVFPESTEDKTVATDSTKEVLVIDVTDEETVRDALKKRIALVNAECTNYYSKGKGNGDKQRIVERLADKMNELGRFITLHQNVLTSEIADMYSRAVARGKEVLKEHSAILKCESDYNNHVEIKKLVQ